MKEVYFESWISFIAKKKTLRFPSVLCGSAVNLPLSTSPLFFYLFLSQILRIERE